MLSNLTTADKEQTGNSVAIVNLNEKIILKEKRKNTFSIFGLIGLVHSEINSYKYTKLSK